MNLLVWLISIVWLGRILLNLLSYINLWYVKEYRWDRMLIHLKTSQGKRILFPSYRKPPISPKTVTLFILTLAVQLWFFRWITGHILFKLFILDLITFPLTGILVLILKIPTFIFHQYQIQKASQILSQHKPLLVIGITGSYGKTSTKEFLVTILSRKYQVVKTEASKNSAIGIAETILKKLKPEDEIFIVEMGAYKKGEISQMVELVQPQIGIITAINAQHQDLFKTLENTMEAKFELIRGLTGKNIAIFNADNKYCLEMSRWAYKHKKEVWLYSKMSNKITHKYKQLFQATNISSNTSSVSCQIKNDKQKIDVVAKILGEHQISNILAVVAAAKACGMSLSEINHGIKNLTTYQKVLQPIVGLNGATYINDTFNNNPDAAKAAIEYLAKTKGKKILVFQPMIELGESAAVSHEEVGELSAKICDLIILTNANFADHFLKGVRKITATEKTFILNTQKAAELIKLKAKQGDTVLFKGKEAENVLNKLLK